jgi:hypothetical protein
MAREMKVLRCMPVRRIVAATDMAARQAQAEMDPTGADFQAFLAAVRRARRHASDLFEVGAGFRHGRSAVHHPGDAITSAVDNPKYFAPCLYRGQLTGRRSGRANSHVSYRSLRGKE